MPSDDSETSRESFIRSGAKGRPPDAKGKSVVRGSCVRSARLRRAHDDEGKGVHELGDVHDSA